MKKIYTYLIPVLTLLAACSKKTDLLFSGTVDERLQAALAKDSSVLVNSINGWKAVLYPGNGQGAYFFHITFHTDGKVTMVGDTDTVTASKPYTSTYRLKAMQLPSLIFDTYGYIHRISDPDPEVTGGVAGAGKTADFEFSFISVNDDSVLLKGNANASSMVMYKATREEKDAYTAGALKRLIDTTRVYTNANKYLFLEYPDGRQMPLGLSMRTKMVILQYVNEQNKIETLHANFYFTRDSLHLNKALTYKGYSFQDIFYDNVTRMFYVKMNGDRVNIRSAANTFKLPLLPELRTQVMTTYAAILLDPEVTEGWPPAFMTIWNDIKTKMTNGGRTLNKVDILFPVANQMQLKFYYLSSGESYVAYATYKMTVNSAGVATFSDATINATLRTAIKSLTDYFLNNRFTFSYVANTFNASLLGGMFHETDNSSYVFGVLE